MQRCRAAIWSVRSRWKRDCPHKRAAGRRAAPINGEASRVSRSAPLHFVCPAIRFDRVPYVPSVTRSAVLFLGVTLILHAQDPFCAQRERMVRDQIVSRGIQNEAVLNAIRLTARHLIV